MDEKKIEKKLFVTKMGKNTIWAYTNRYISIDGTRFGYSSAVCKPDGRMSKVLLRFTNYTTVKRSLSIYPDSIFIECRANIDGTTVEIYETEKIDKKNKKVIFKRLAAFEDGKWDNTEYLKTFKRAITSVRSRAKKIYNMMDIK